MYEDVVDLRDFYQSSLGRVACRLVRQRIRHLWPDTAGANLLGLGYATPYLGPFAGEAARTLACMPASQGVIRWPVTEPNRVALSDETTLPLPSGAFDRILVVHGLERSEHARAFLREIWRVLAPSGRLLVVVPNRRGIWARLDRTPFGDGSPFTPSQLTKLLRDSLFMPERTATALYVPPSASRMLLTAAPAWEQIGRRWFPTFAGVILVEATKQIYAAPPLRVSWRGHRVARPVTAGGELQGMQT